MTTLTDILASCESLGDSDTFGLVQRAAGVETPGFFRMNSAKLPALLEALERDFAGIDDRANLHLSVEHNGEYRVHVAGYDFSWRTGKFQAAIEPAQVLEQQVIGVHFLLRKLRQEIAGATKLFVRKGRDTLHQDDAVALLRALRRFGPATLLWVVPSNPGYSAGMVRVLSDGLLQGFIDQFDSPDDQLPVAWSEICRNAYALWRGDCLPGTIIARVEDKAANLIGQSDTFGGAGWTTGDGAACTLSHAVPRLLPQAEVVVHVLELASGSGVDDLQSYAVADGLVPGEIYTGEMDVWIEPNFTGSEIGPVFEGVASIATHNADLKARSQWQRVWVTAAMSDDAPNATLILRVRGPEGSRVFSTRWRLERGARPSPNG